MNLSPDEFGEMRIGDFWDKLHGWGREKEERFRLQAELTRLQTADLVNVHLKKEDRIAPGQLWRFPWEEEEEKEEQDPKKVIEQNKRLIDVLNKAQLNKNNG